ncbi:MAG: hypothetical protein LBJ45_00130 [Holosporaceae bacterium]|nr:hypothetical protein [Holosporaceae bacterium]
MKKNIKKVVLLAGLMVCFPLINQSSMGMEEARDLVHLMDATDRSNSDLPAVLRDFRILSTIELAAAAKGPAGNDTLLEVHNSIWNIVRGLTDNGIQLAIIQRGQDEVIDALNRENPSCVIRALRKRNQQVESLFYTLEHQGRPADNK